MNIEVMIYVYGAVCVSMIMFNFVYNMMLKWSVPRMKRRREKFERMVMLQLSEIRRSGEIDPRHAAVLRRKLCHVNDLMAFHMVINEGDAGKSELAETYLRQIRPAILYLALVYRDKANDKAGYFTYFLSNYTAGRQMPVDSLQDILLEYVRKENLYCRFNALKVLYHMANPEYVVRAIKIADDGNVFMHNKLITEGLLSYSGDHGQLISQLWSEFSGFSNHMKLAILNYIRFCSGDYKEEMYAIMTDRAENIELRLSAIRYLGKYYYGPARDDLIGFVLDGDMSRWEYATVAASSLASYPGQEVVDALKEALHSGNWYVRYSASQSLEHHNVDYSDILDITAGNDRYAREMMMYRLESRKLQSAEV